MSNGPAHSRVGSDKRQRSTGSQTETRTSTPCETSTTRAEASESPGGKQNHSEMWPEEPVVAKHASPRKDEKAFKYPLQHSVSFRTTNVGGPTFQADKEFEFHGRVHSYLLPALLDRPDLSLLLALHRAFVPECRAFVPEYRQLPHRVNPSFYLWRVNAETSQLGCRTTKTTTPRPSVVHCFVPLWIKKRT